MKVFGFEISRTKSLTAINSNRGWYNLVREAFGGAFQQDIASDGTRQVLAFSAVFSCVTVIASDIAKLGVNLMEEDAGIHSKVVSASPFLAVLNRPNSYQTWFKFIEQWIVSKLLYGNTYALKRRDNRGIVTGLYILHPERVTPMVSTSGDVFYQLNNDYLAGLETAITVPASEIMHDTMVSLWHPLVGVSPIYACGVSATMGNRIQANSTRFFGNASRPSGALTAPGSISDETAARLKAAWEANYGGANIGSLAVLGDGLKYEAMTIPANDSQLLQQLDWTVQDVARCFHVPMWKLGGAEPARVSVESLNQTYYSDCLQALIESAEAVLDYGLGLPSQYHIEFNLNGLMRMDTAARYDAKNKAVAGGWMTPNEARAGEDMAPVIGGDTPYLQQQNYSLSALAKRDALDDPFGTATKPAATVSPTVPEAEPAPSENGSSKAQELLDYIIKGLVCST